ncbi:hypothetical protein L9F63_007486, partial [Diploptera punctata]
SMAHPVCSIQSMKESTTTLCPLPALLLYKLRALCRSKAGSGTSNRTQKKRLVPVSLNMHGIISIAISPG